jgi:hypothetical protein
VSLRITQRVGTAPVNGHFDRAAWNNYRELMQAMSMFERMHYEDEEHGAQRMTLQTPAGTEKLTPSATIIGIE